MRQLLGKIPTKDRAVAEEVYLSEQIRCRECQRTVPMGIEVVLVRKEGKTKTVLKRSFFCRPHGADYQVRSQAR